jgi:hypothetical protein
MSCMTANLGLDFWRGQEIFLFFTASSVPLGGHTASNPEAERRDVKLTSCLSVKVKVKKEGAKPSSPKHALY